MRFILNSILAKKRSILIALFISLLATTTSTAARAQYSGFDSGYDGGYDGGYGGGNDGSYTPNDGCYGSCGGTPPKLSGYVFEDNDQSGTYNPGDRGLSDVDFGEPMIVQVIRPAYTIPASTTPAYCEYTHWDETGNPTGEQTCYPAVYHPEVSYPDLVVGQAATDTTGHYEINNIPSGIYRVHHTKDPLPSGWARTTPNDVSLNINRSARMAFGIVNTSFAQNLPESSCVGPTPNIHISWAPLSNASGYKIFYNTPLEASYLETPSLLNTQRDYYFAPNTIPLTPGNPYTFIIAALNASGSIIAYSDDAKWSIQQFGTYTPYPADCSSPSPSPSTPASPPPTTPPTSSPVVSLWINGVQNGTVPFIEISQNSAQPSLTWQVSNTPNNSCIASAASIDGSAAPAGINSAWNGPKGPPPIAPATGGPIAIPTSTAGKFLFSLICTNSTGTTSSTLQLNINQFPPPYFQTTGGDVHSNETIYISQ